MRAPTHLAFLLAAATALAACSDPQIDVTYEAYSGTAFPNLAPKIAWPATGAAVITNSYSDSLGVVDLAQGKSIFTRPIGRNPVDLDGPHHVAVDPTTRFAFTALAYPRVAATGPHAAHGSALVPGYVEKISLDDFSIVGNVRVEDNPGDIVLSDDKTKLVVSHFDLQRATQNPTDITKARADVAIIDPTKIELSDSAKPTYINTCVAPHGVALDKAGKTAYVACYGEDMLAVVDLDDVTATPELIPVTAGVSGFGNPTFGPYAAVMSPDQTTVAVSDTESKDVRLFDVASKTFDDAKAINLSGAPYFTTWSADGATLYIPTQTPDALVAMPMGGSPDTPAEPKTIDFDPSDCQLPHIATLVDDKLYVICEGDHKTIPGSLVVLDLDLKVLSSSPLALYPDAFAVLPKGFQ